MILYKYNNDFHRKTFKEERCSNKTATKVKHSLQKRREEEEEEESRRVSNSERPFYQRSTYSNESINRGACHLSPASSFEDFENDSIYLFKIVVDHAGYNPVYATA